jgi:hypothetical protein
MTPTRLALVLIALLASAPFARAQGRGADGPRDRGPLEVITAPTKAGIAWIEGWTAAKAEAKRSERPILLMSAAPACGGLPGAW